MHRDNNDPHRVAAQGKVEYNCKQYTVLDANGWKHIMVTVDGKRKRIGLSDIEKEKCYGQTMPVYFGYVFEGLFLKGDNEYYDKRLNIK